MASIVFGGGITNIVGSHAGNTFARNKGGAYMKKKTHGTNPRSGNQMKTRTQVGRLAKHYTYTLSDAQRSAWRTYASTNPSINRLGNTTFLSGQQMFSKLSANILNSGNTIVATPPATNAVGAITNVTIAAVSGAGGSITVTSFIAAPTANDVCFVYLSSPLNPGRAFVSSQLRRMSGSMAVNAAHFYETDYKAAFGLLPTAAGQRIFCRMIVVNTATGVTSAMFQTSALWS